MPVPNTGKAVLNFPLRFMAIRKTDAAPKIDGKLDDACWKDAAVAKDFVLWVKRDGALVLMKKKTTVSLTYDDKAIYLGFKCEEPDIESLHKNRLWEEGVEMFLDTTHDHKTFYQIGVTPGGTMAQTAGKHAKWDKPIDVRTSFGDGYWFAEIALPFASLDMACPPVGTTWGFNLCRTLFGRKVYGTFAPLSDLSFHLPWDFADLYFTGTEKMPLVIESIAFKDGVLLGSNEATVTIRNDSSEEMTCSLKAGEQDAVKTTVASGKKQEVAVMLDVKQLKKNALLNLSLLSADGKKEYYRCAYGVKPPNEIMSFSLDGDIFFSDEKTIPVSFGINMSKSALKTASFELLLKDKDGKTIAKQLVKDIKSSHSKLKVDVSKLQTGAYGIELLLRDSSGKLLASPSAEFRKVEAAD